MPTTTDEPEARRGSAARDGAPKPARETLNEVRLVGRLAAPVDGRTLPSGDELVTWRLVVDRPPEERRAVGGRRPPSVDTIDCVTRRAGIRRTAAAWRPGDVLEVSGTLRRRFWRAGAATASRCEVEVSAARRRSRGPTPSGVGVGPHQQSGPRLRCEQR